ncbi:MAG TPA: sigma-70 family RNA polymerase sigma factor [Chiayiivirga sp.]|nr:sigma-70 family RNA polymerase sigma factor [Chiayiivirga sp.]
MNAELDRWFVHEVLIHESALMHYLRRAWWRADDWPDLRQDVYARVYEAALRERPRAPRAFLLTTARHLIADRLRRLNVVSIEAMGDRPPSNVYWMDEVSPEQVCGGRQMLRRLSRALEQLPPRCREVIWLRRVEGLAQREVAEHLGITEKTVEKHLAKGMRLLADTVFGGANAPDVAFTATVREARLHARPQHD